MAYEWVQAFQARLGGRLFKTFEEARAQDVTDAFVVLASINSGDLKVDVKNGDLRELDRLEIAIEVLKDAATRAAMDALPQPARAEGN